MDRPEPERPPTEAAEARRDGNRLLPAAVVVGLVTGIIVVGVRYLIYDVMWLRILSTNSGLVFFLAPALGVFLSGLILQLFAERPEIHDTEQYLVAYHRGWFERRPRSVVAKLVAAVSTLGFGGGAGLEGPSMFVGSSIGEWASRLLRRLGFERHATRTLLVAGAAAGISAIFKAPLTGIVFALEVPYTNDFARDALVPALVASVSSYFVAISLLGPEALFVVNHAYVPDVRTLMLALLLGVVIGGAARLFLLSLKTAESLAERASLPLAARTAIGGVVCGVFGVVSFRLFGSPLAIGSGYQLIDATTTTAKFVGLAAIVLLVLRGGAVVATLGSGASGGTFVPLVSMGAVTGAVFQGLAPATGALFPIVGMAAFLGAAHATPIAAAVFTAESTGTAGYVIPGLVAAASAYVVAGGQTLAAAQRPRHRGSVSS